MRSPVLRFLALLRCLHTRSSRTRCLQTQPELAGLFLGTSIHETAQVAGAGLMYEEQYAAPRALDIATVTKLVRNLCMIAVIPLVGVLYAADQKSHLPEGKVRWLSMIPWFIIGFALMSTLRTVGDLGDRPFGVMDSQTWSDVDSLRQGGCRAVSPGGNGGCRFDINVCRDARDWIAAVCTWTVCRDFDRRRKPADNFPVRRTTDRVGWNFLALLLPTINRVRARPPLSGPGRWTWTRQLRPAG